MHRNSSVPEIADLVPWVLTPDSKAFLPAVQLPPPSLRWGGGIGSLRACRSKARPLLSPSVTRLGLWQCGFAQRYHKPLKPPGEGEGYAIISFINR